MPWGVLLSPLLMMTTLSYVAFRGSAPPPTDWATVQAERNEGRVAPSDRGAARVSERGDSTRVYLRNRRWGADGVFDQIVIRSE
ncbi:MAG: hypothetical protein VYE73_00150 [Acidobacteriota bacterium]|nr:hypothetical protein [Acidobacteriota bacterium]